MLHSAWTAPGPRRRAWLAVATWLVAGTVQAQLINGDLDEPSSSPSNLATGWTLIEDEDTMGAPINTADFVDFANRTPGGVRGLWFRPFVGGSGAPNPDTVSAELVQDIIGIPGAEYALTAWFRLEQGYSGLDPMEPTQTLLALEFFDGGGRIGEEILDIDTVYDVGNVGIYQQFGVSATAPPGTETVRARAAMIEGSLSAVNPQSLMVDDLELVGPLVGLLDLDGDGVLAPLTDGLLLLRYLFGLTGSPLTHGAVGVGCTRCDAAAIEEYLANPPPG